MKNKPIHIVTYDPTFDQQLLTLEREAVQGTWVKLEMLRPSYLSRSLVFEDWMVLVALKNKADVVGAVSTAKVPFQIGPSHLTTAFVFDARVKKDYQSQGIGRQLLAAIKSYNEQTLGITHQFYTAKASSLATRILAGKLSPGFYSYHFVYLTIPTGKRLGTFQKSTQSIYFQPTLFDPAPKDYQNFFSGGLKIWDTSKMYSLRIQKMKLLAKWGLTALSFINPYLKNIREGYQLRFATLFDFSYPMLEEINEVLEFLQRNGTDFLHVVCRKDDPVYRLLQPLAMSVYPYSIDSTFVIPEDTDIKIDVRCL